MLFKIAGTSETVSFSPRSVLIAGFTGRDERAVDAHIRELVKEGVQPPDSVPAFYEVPSSLLSTAGRVEAGTAESSGEVEPVLLFTDEGWYVAVGSDHTARDLERVDIAQSKAACPKPISGEVWPYEEVSQDWDRILLRSWVRVDGEKVLYQEAPLGELLAVPDVLEALKRETREGAEGAAVFLGTVPLRTHAFVFSDWFSVEMHDPSSGRSLGLTYEVDGEERPEKTPKSNASSPSDKANEEVNP